MYKKAFRGKSGSLASLLHKPKLPQIRRSRPVEDVTRRFLTRSRKIFKIHRLLQEVNDSRNPEQCVYPSAQMAGLCLLYCLAMPRSNGNFFQVYMWKRALRLLLGLKPGNCPSQDAFEYVIRCFNQ